MSKLEYTPGPWKWVGDDFWGGYSGIVGKYNAEVLFPDCSNDGDSGAAWFDDFPSEADGKLIVSAPDMYEALLEIRRHCEGDGIAGTLNDIKHIADKVLMGVEE